MLEKYLRSLLIQVSFKLLYKVSFLINIGVARHYKVCSLEPNCNGAASVDPNLSWECIMKVGNVLCMNMI